MKETTEVAIVGAGPNGLAVAAHLAHAGIERVVFGHPLATWANHMPQGMRLKSEPYGSDISAPVEGHRLSDFCSLEGIEYRDRGLPVALETFVSYGEWYANRFVPDVRQCLVTNLAHDGAMFRITTESGEGVAARRVIVATGLLPFAHIPAELEGFPAELVTHAWAHADLARFRSKRVGVIGAGQTALETAALLHEAGADVELIARTPALTFSSPYPPRSAWSSLKRPVTKTCEGWPCWGYHNLPDVFRSWPAELRTRKSLEFLGPSGAWWLTPRVVDTVPARTGVAVRQARISGERVRLSIDGENGGEVEYDHVIAGTGYRLDVNRLRYISADLRRRVVSGGGIPVLSRSFQSRMPGLFFVGGLAAPSLGPSMRFLSGTEFTARRLTRRLRWDRQVRRAGSRLVDVQGRLVDGQSSEDGMEGETAPPLDLDVARRAAR